MNMNELKKYMHPMEKEITEVLDGKLISREYQAQLIEMYNFFELETLMPDLIGKSMEINEQQMPELYKIFKELAGELEMPVPSVYIFEGRYCDVNAEGFEKPWIQVSTKTLEDFETEELKYAIARQLVHIKLGHMKYEILCEQFSKSISIASQLGGSLVNFVPGASVASNETFEVYAAHFKLVASQWSRISEYTADRCALVLCNWDIKNAVSAIKKQILNSRKLADEMNLSSYLKQADSILALTKPVAKYSIMDEQYPYGPFRIKELIAFASTN